MYQSLLHYYKVVKQSNNNAIESSPEEVKASLNARKEFDTKFKACLWSPKRGQQSTTQGIDEESGSDDQSRDENGEKHLQGDWLQVKQFCISPRHYWPTIFNGWNDEILRFYCNALQCKLPDPCNLKLWKISENSKCFLCQSPSCTAQHILSSCRVALNQGRYSYRHDRVLAIIREAISLALAKTKKVQPCSSTRYVHPNIEASAEESTRSFTPLWLAKAPDWCILIDSYNNHYIFPEDIIPTHLRPDLMVYSKSLRKILMVELTVPWEMNIPHQHVYKENKYAKLLRKLKERGFDSQLFAVEVGVRGLVAKSLQSFLNWLGLPEKNICSYLSRVSKTAIEASYIIWTQRNQTWKV